MMHSTLLNVQIASNDMQTCVASANGHCCLMQCNAPSSLQFPINKLENDTAFELCELCKLTTIALLCSILVRHACIWGPDACMKRMHA